MKKAAIIIPARYNASRFEGKLLKALSEKSVLQHVYEKALQIQYAERIVIATDDDRILKEASAYCPNVMMTSAEHKSGTDRCAEIANHLEQDIIINIQGDEPFINPASVDELIMALQEESVSIATLKTLITDPEDIQNINVVKVVSDLSDHAIYFSRSSIPNLQKSKEQMDYYRHIGVYGFQRDVLLAVSTLDRSPLEIAESLEQLRWMDNQYRIKILKCDEFGPGIDTPADLVKAKKYLGQ